MSDAKNTIYCFNNGGSAGWLMAVAIADDGHVVAQHCCSHECYMAHDLGIVGDWKHEQYNEHFGEGNWQLEWVANPKDHEGLAKALELNQQLALLEQAETEAQP